ncbi:MAG: ABC transporter transmembrane domain-containing protein [Pseudonocardiaceae bacterium]
MSQDAPQPDTPRLTTDLEALLRFARPAKGALTVAVLLAFVSTALELAPFYLLYAAVQALVTGGGADLVTLGLIAAGATIGRFVLWGRAMFVSHVTGGNVLRQLRMSLAQRLARLPLGYFDRRHSGEVTKVLADDIERLELFLAHAIPEFVSAVGVWLAVTGWLLIVDWRLALTSIAVVPVAAVLVRRSMAGSSGHIATVSARRPG